MPSVRGASPGGGGVLSVSAGKSGVGAGHAGVGAGKAGVRGVVKTVKTKRRKR